MKEKETLQTKWKNIAKGVLAILIWIALYAVVQWFFNVGWFGYLSFAIPVALILHIATRVSSRAREFLTKRLPEALDWIFDIYEEKMEWVVYFMIVLMSGGILYFILFAPYGLLCHLGLRPCGR